jgi:hypothetical protein
MWKVLNVVLWIACLTVAMPLSLVIGLNILLAPLAIAIGCAVGTSARRMTSWTCPRCDSELLEPEPQTEFATLPAGA